MQLIPRKEKAGEFLFTIGLFLEILVMITDNCASWTIPYRGRIVQLAFVLFCIKICTTRYSIKQWLVIIILGILGAVSYLTCGEELVIRAIIFVVAAKDIDVKVCIKFLLYSTLISTIIIMALSMLGICGQVVDIRDYGRGVVEARYQLGFNHANNVQDTLWMLIMLYAIIKGCRFKIYDAVILTIVNIGLYMLTISRTGVIASELVIIGCFIANNVCNNIFAKLVNVFTIVITLFCLYLTLLSAKFNIGTSRIEAFFDRYLTGRLEMVSERADIANWRLIPFGFESTDVDNGFAFIGYSYGYIVLLVLLIAIIWLSYRLSKMNDFGSGVILLSVVLVIFMESSFIFNVSMTCNMLLIMLIVFGINDGINNKRGVFCDENIISS